MSNQTSICGNGGKQLESCIYWYLFNAISDGIIVIEWTAEKKLGKIIEINEVVCNLLGWERNDLIGCESSKVLPVEDIYDKEVSDYELKLKRKNDSEFIAELTVSRMFAHGMEATVVVLRDLTNKKAAEAIRMKNERFIGALATAGAACHELNQPLQALMGYTDMLGRVLGNDPEKGRWITQLQSQADRISAITRKLNSITHIEEQDYIQGTKIMDLERSIS